MQELYDSRTLHRIVGVPAKAHHTTPSNGTSTNGTDKPAKHKSKSSKHKSKSKESKSVSSAWEEADMELASDDDHPRQRDDGEVEEEEGRYGIEKRHRTSSRRRKTGASTVMFITDDDESDVSEVKVSKKAPVDVPITEFVNEREDEDEREEGEYVSGGEDAGDGKLASEKGESAERRRSYWLSKANGLGEDDSS